MKTCYVQLDLNVPYEATFEILLSLVFLICGVF